MSKNIAAFTAAGSCYPPYISINRVDEDAVEITVRSPASPEGTCGTTSMIRLTQQQWEELMADCRRTW